MIANERVKAFANHEHRYYSQKTLMDWEIERGEALWSEMSIEEKEIFENHDDWAIGLNHSTGVLAGIPEELHR